MRLLRYLAHREYRGLVLDTLTLALCAAFLVEMAERAILGGF